MEEIIWGIDPGSSICGVCELRSGLIGNVFECEPTKVFNRIMSICGSHRINIVIEDIFPYSMKLTPAVIATCKLIGGIAKEFEIKYPDIPIHYVPRNSIKNWVYNTVPDVCIPRINKKMLAKHTRNTKAGLKGLIKLDGEMRQPSFNWVDDYIVKEAMKIIHKIPDPLPGKSNIYGIKKDSHAWQALAVCSFFFHSIPNSNS